MISLLIDAHGLGYRAHHSLGGLSHDGTATGIAFGFLSSLLQLSERYKTNRMIFCWDAGGSRRREECPEYKADRADKTPEERAERAAIHAQFNALRDDVLPAAGFGNHLIQHGYEADDMIAIAVIKYPVSTFAVVSSDHDLFQLLQYPNCKLQHLLSSGKAMTASMFQAEYRVPARKWPLVKAMAGCPGDGVKGVAGVGEKTAIKYLLGELPEGRKYQELCQSQARINFNYKLVRLPFPGAKPPIIIKDQLDENRMCQAFSDLGFSSFVSGRLRERWGRFCRGEFV